MSLELYEAENSAPSTHTHTHTHTHTEERYLISKVPAISTPKKKKTYKS
jgi:hypothetical protein